MDPIKTHGEKIKWELRKNAACCQEQIMGPALHKTAAARPPASYLTNHLSKTNKTCDAQLISGILLWTPALGRACVGHSVKACWHQHCVHTGCNLEKPLRTYMHFSPVFIKYSTTSTSNKKKHSKLARTHTHTHTHTLIFTYYD